VLASPLALSSPRSNLSFLVATLPLLPVVSLVGFFSPESQPLVRRFSPPIPPHSPGARPPVNSPAIALLFFLLQKFRIRSQFFTLVPVWKLPTPRSFAVVFRDLEHELTLVFWFMVSFPVFARPLSPGVLTSPLTMILAFSCPPNRSYFFFFPFCCCYLHVPFLPSFSPCFPEAFPFLVSDHVTAGKNWTPTVPFCPPHLVSPHFLIRLFPVARSGPLTVCFRRRYQSMFWSFLTRLPQFVRCAVSACKVCSGAFSCRACGPALRSFTRQRLPPLFFFFLPPLNSIEGDP